LLGIMPAEEDGLVWSIVTVEVCWG